MTLHPASDATPAAWIVGADEPWHVVATYGPPGLEAYARVSIAADDEHPWEIDDLATYVDPDRRRWEDVVRVLAGFTSSPGRVHVGLWVGGNPALESRVHVASPGREYALLTGSVDDCLDRRSLGRPVSFGPYDIADLVWPDDRAWVISWDTDEEAHYTVGGSRDAIDAVLSIDGLRGSVVPYGTPEPDWNW